MLARARPHLVPPPHRVLVAAPARPRRADRLSVRVAPGAAIDLVLSGQRGAAHRVGRLGPSAPHVLLDENLSGALGLEPLDDDRVRALRLPRCLAHEGATVSVEWRWGTIQLVDVRGHVDRCAWLGPIAVTGLARIEMVIGQSFLDAWRCTPGRRGVLFERPSALPIDWSSRRVGHAVGRR